MMSVLEYASSFISIIVGLAIADLLTSFHRLLRVDARVIWYWLVPAAAAYLLLVTVDFWWGAFRWFEKVRALSMAQFLPILLAAIILFLVTAAVLPDEIPDNGLDLHSWYDSNRRHIWTLWSIGLFLVVALQASGRLTSTDRALAFVRLDWENLLLLAGSASLIFVRKPRVHEAYILLALLDMAYRATSLEIS
jgi:hypothetical protein